MATNIFEKVLENVDIVDVVSKYVHLEPKGKNLFGLCPFHDDNNPSMSVSRERGIFQCWVCHKAGNAIKFIEEYKHLSVLEATKFLANEYHIDISEYQKEKQDKTKKDYEIMGLASKFYTFLMNDENVSKEAREYLNKRGINDKTIKEYQIGIAPSDEKALTNSLVSKGYLMSDIIENGLSNGTTDIFTDRIIVPIRDTQGRTVAFGGRIYKDDSSSLNKYLNSKETNIFRKGELVFNLDKAIRSLSKVNYLILNEGYMDVISSYASGILNSVALMGTSMTKEQAELISKYTKNVVICLDGDDAGIKAVKTCINRLEEVNVNYSITILKDGLDPDEYLRKYGKDKYLEEITKNRLDKIGYLYELTKLDYPNLSSFNLESFKNDIFEKIKGETSKTAIEVYLKRLSLDLKVSYESISEDYKYFINRFKPIKKDNKKVDERFKIISIKDKAEEFMINYSIKDYSYYKMIIDSFDRITFMTNKNYRKIFVEISDLYDTNSNFKSNDLIDELIKRGVYKDFIFDEKIDYSKNDLDKNIINNYKKSLIKDEIKNCENELFSGLKSKEEKIEIQKRLIELKKEFRR